MLLSVSIVFSFRSFAVLVLSSSVYLIEGVLGILVFLLFLVSSFRLASVFLFFLV